MAERLAAHPSSKRNPLFGSCCRQGKINLPLLPAPPLAIRHLYVGDSTEAREFRTHIRKYNAALAFTSVGDNQDHAINRRGGSPWVYRISAELRHRAGTLLPSEGRSPTYLQLYFFDPHDSLEYRMQHNPTLRPDTMDMLQNTLSHSHQYVEWFQHAYEILAEHPNSASNDVALRLCSLPNRDQRRYNLPTADEVALIVPGTGSQSTDRRDIILRRQDGPLERISEGHEAYMPLHYVLLFPHGTDGWSWDMKYTIDPETGRQKRLSLVRFLNFRLSPRDEEFNTILRGGRLFQQFSVDLWSMIEAERLLWARLHQDEC
jgi:hypothetical protein